jgi:hypothetical protein
VKPFIDWMLMALGVLVEQKVDLSWIVCIHEPAFQ